MNTGSGAERQFLADIAAIRKAVERIADALETPAIIPHRCDCGHSLDAHHPFGCNEPGCTCLRYLAMILRPGMEAR